MPSTNPQQSNIPFSRDQKNPQTLTQPHPTTSRSPKITPVDRTVIISVNSSLQPVISSTTPRQVTLHVNSVETPLRTYTDVNNQISYGTISTSNPTGAVHVQVDDHLPWPAAHRRRGRWIRRKRSGCTRFCLAILRFIVLLALFCGVAAGLLLAWEHRREVRDWLREVGLHILWAAREVVLWLIAERKAVGRWVGDRLRS